MGDAASGAAGDEGLPPRSVLFYPGHRRGMLDTALESGADETPLAPSFEQLPEREWTSVWQDDWRPLRFGERLWVAPLAADVADPGAIVVRLDPGLAFGTGTHATTGLCLEWLERQLLADAHVLDYGCGSGVLAIAALRLGARCATSPPSSTFRPPCSAAATTTASKSTAIRWSTPASSTATR